MKRFLNRFFFFGGLDFLQEAFGSFHFLREPGDICWAGYLGHRDLVCAVSRAGALDGDEGHTDVESDQGWE